jgi:hypothetical protein
MFFYYSESLKNDTNELMSMKTVANNSILSSEKLKQIDKINQMTKNIVLYFDDLIINKKKPNNIKEYILPIVSNFTKK